MEWSSGNLLPASILCSGAVADDNAVRHAPVNQQSLESNLLTSELIPPEMEYTKEGWDRELLQRSGLSAGIERTNGLRWSTSTGKARGSFRLCLKIAASYWSVRGLAPITLSPINRDERDMMQCFELQYHSLRPTFAFPTSLNQTEDKEAFLKKWRMQGMPW